MSNTLNSVFKYVLVILLFIVLWMAFPGNPQETKMQIYHTIPYQVKKKKIEINQSQNIIQYLKMQNKQLTYIR